MACSCCTVMETSAGVALMAGDGGVGTWFWLSVGFLSFFPCGTCWSRKVLIRVDTERLEQTSQGSLDCLSLGPSFKGMRTAKVGLDVDRIKRGEPFWGSSLVWGVIGEGGQTPTSV